MISDSISSMTSNTTEILCTKRSHVISNTRSLTDNLQPCSQEEADTRLLLHVRDIASSGLRKIMIIASDTDVVVIALYIFHSLFIEELWIEFGAGKHRRWLPIHRYAALLGEEICRALPLWYALTGCDTVSSFAGRGKKTAWDTWGDYFKCVFSQIKFTVY